MQSVGRVRLPTGLKTLALSRYVQGEGSVRSIAMGLKLTPCVVDRWAQQDGWNKLRKAFEQGQKFKFTVAHTVQTRVESLLASIEKETDPDGLRALYQSLEIALRCWSLLTGHPRPGSRRPAKEPKPSPGYQDSPPMV